VGFYAGFSVALIAGKVACTGSGKVSVGVEVERYSSRV
jgi:hypothetical protein